MNIQFINELPTQNGKGNYVKIGTALDGTVTYRNPVNGETIAVEHGTLRSAGKDFGIAEIARNKTTVRVDRHITKGNSPFVVGAAILVAKIKNAPRSRAGIAWILNGSGQVGQPHDPLAGARKIVSEKLDDLASKVRSRLGRELFASAAERETWVHDLALMLHARALKSVHVEFLSSTKTIVGIERLGFSADEFFKKSSPGTLLSNMPAVDFRTTISQGEIPPAIAAKFKSKWGTAESLKALTMEKVGSRELPTSDRQILLMNRTGDEYSFAQTMDGKLVGIFCKAREFAPGMTVAVGDKVSAFVLIEDGKPFAKVIRPLNHGKI